MSTFITTGFVTERAVKFDEDSPFPDGQPHVKFLGMQESDSFDPTESKVINCRITSPADLLNVALAINVLRSKFVRRIYLNIFYLMGARMDRPLSFDEPYTLRVVCDIINSFGCESVSVFCPHSQTTSDLLHNFHTMRGFENIFFEYAIGSCFSRFVDGSFNYDNDYDSIVFPDHGALKRFGKSELLEKFPNASIVTLEKDRNERTGEVKGVKLINGQVNPYCVIVDDLCDGGRTFEESAKCLREFGAKRVGLVVAHGIMSKGVIIPGIDYTITTNSYSEHKGIITTAPFKVFKL